VGRKAAVACRASAESVSDGGPAEATERLGRHADRGHHLWSEFLGAVDQFSTHYLISGLASAGCQQLDAVVQRTLFGAVREIMSYPHGL